MACLNRYHEETPLLFRVMRTNALYQILVQIHLAADKWQSIQLYAGRGSKIEAKQIVESSASAFEKLTGKVQMVACEFGLYTLQMAGVQRNLKALQNNTLFFGFYLAVGLSKTTRKPTNSKALWGKPLSRRAERKDAALLV